MNCRKSVNNSITLHIPLLTTDHLNGLRTERKQKCDKKDVSQLLYVMMKLSIKVLFCKKNALFFYQFENYD